MLDGLCPVRGGGEITFCVLQLCGGILRRIVGKSQFHASQTLLSPRTVWRGPWQTLQNQTSWRRNVSCDICVVRWISG